MSKIYKIEEDGMYDSIIRYYAFLVENNLNPDLVSFKEYYNKHYVVFDTEYIILDDNDRVVGNGTLDASDDDSLNVYIHISEQERGRGLGTKVIKRMIDDMKKRPTVKSLKMVDLSPNNETKKIATKLGFAEQDTYFEYNNPFYKTNQK